MSLFLCLLFALAPQSADPDDRNDRAESFVASWRARVQTHPVLSSYNGYQVGTAALPFVFFVHLEGFKTRPDIERLSRRLGGELEEVVERFKKWIAGPLGAGEDFEESFRPVWLTADQELFSWSLPFLGVRDRRSHTAWFSVADRAVFALLDATGSVRGDALQEFRLACARALVDGLGPRGFSAVRNAWVADGLAWLIATGGEAAARPVWREDVERFLQGVENGNLDAATSLWSGSGLAQTDSDIAAGRGLSDEELVWRESATHAVVASLFFSKDEGVRERLLGWLSAELAGGPVEDFPARALGLRGPRALIDQARVHARESLGAGENPGAQVSVASEDLPPRLTCLLLLARFDLKGAAKQAREQHLAQELAAAERILAFLERLGVRLGEQPQSVSIQAGGRRERFDAVGVREDRILVRDPVTGEVSERPAELFGLRLVSMARRADLSGPEDHAVFAILGALQGDTRLARREAGHCEGLAWDVGGLLARWAEDLPELDARRALDALLADDSGRLPDRIRKARRHHGHTAAWDAELPALRNHLRDVLARQIADPGDLVAQAVPGAEWDAATRRLTIRYDFSQPEQLEDFAQGSYPVLSSIFHYLPQTRPAPWHLSKGMLAMEGLGFARHRVWLASPIEIELRRALNDWSIEDLPGKDYLGPVFIVGLLDDGVGSFVAVERSFLLVDVRQGRMDAFARCPEGHVEDVTRGRFHSMRIRCAEKGVEVWLDGERTISLERGLPLGGRLFFQTAGAGSVTIDDLSISGSLDERAEKRLRETLIDGRLSAILGGDQ